MATPAEILREIHRLRKHILDLQQKVEQAPRAVKLQKDRLAKQEQTLKEAQDVLKHLKVKIHEKDVSRKAVQQQIDKYQKQLKEQITSKKEYDALTAEIAQGKATLQKLEDEELEAMAEVEDRSAKMPEAEQAFKKAQADFAQFEADHAERLKRYADETARARVELKAAEETLPEDARTVYERQTAGRGAAGRGADALAAVSSRNCTGCYIEVTPQMVNELARGMLVVCKSCGRLLYLEA